MNVGYVLCLNISKLISLSSLFTRDTRERGSYVLQMVRIISHVLSPNYHDGLRKLLSPAGQGQA